MGNIAGEEKEKEKDFARKKAKKCWEGVDEEEIDEEKRKERKKEEKRKRTKILGGSR